MKLYRFRACIFNELGRGGRAVMNRGAIIYDPIRFDKHMFHQWLPAAAGACSSHHTSLDSGKKVVTDDFA